MKRKTKQASKASPVYERIRQILESARTNVARSVNTTQVVANWLIGREIVEELQKGQLKAEYGKMLVQELAEHLQADFGKGYSALNLWLFRRFYEEYPGLTGPEILYALRKESGCNIPHAARAELNAGTISDAMSRKTVVGDASAIIGDASRSQSWQPGQLHPNLSWTHYRTLLRVDKPEARAFYEIEAIKNNWSARDLERQINSLLYERLAMSRDKSGLMKLATMCLRLRSADALTPVCGIFRMCTATWWMPGRTTTTRAGCPF